LVVYSGLGRPARMLPAYGTRREYIPVGSRAASLPHTVPQAGSTRAGTEPRAKRESGKEKSSRLVRTFRQRVCLALPGPSEAMDGRGERTGMYLQRVPEGQDTPAARTKLPTHPPRHQTAPIKKPA